VKEMARQDVFKPAAEIVDTVMMQMTTNGNILQKPELLTRAANLHRQKLRPNEPTDLKFDVRFIDVINIYNRTLIMKY
jgi:hypothetical protein